MSSGNRCFLFITLNKQPLKISIYNQHSLSARIFMFYVYPYLVSIFHRNVHNAFTRRMWVSIQYSTIISPETQVPIHSIYEIKEYFKVAYTTFKARNCKVNTIDILIGNHFRIEDYYTIVLIRIVYRYILGYTYLYVII